MNQLSELVERITDVEKQMMKFILATGKLRDMQATTTLCLKKVPTCKLSVILSNLNRFSKFLHY